MSSNTTLAPEQESGPQRFAPKSADRSRLQTPQSARLRGKPTVTWGAKSAQQTPRKPSISIESLPKTDLLISCDIRR